MSEESNKDVIRRVEEAWNSQDLGALDELFSPNFDNSATAVPGMPGGLAGAKMAHRSSMESFPDRQVFVDALIAGGDKVTVRGHFTGTNQGGLAWLGIPANNNAIDVNYISIYRLEDGKVAEHWAINDVMTLMTQLGAMPAPDGATPPEQEAVAGPPPA
ncbi:MAG TPA: ester cyclase [Actinobacteria bacterium]|nr:ester cyclase [Actinomycetota bacterium]HCP61085.1 ester cyclase [Actinomycetota bacterium]